jgi:16S rRNA U516 pseudouridylate synthase RsuA-like enzyme
LSLTAGFAIGYYYNALKSYNKKPYNQEIIMKKDITIAIDEHNNLIMFNKKTGSYVTYQDSVGLSVFNFYAKSLWRENSVTPKP